MFLFVVLVVNVLCRLDYARQKAVRAEHELRLWAPTHDSSFLSLTYSDEFLPAGNTLVKRDLQLFMKRLRKERGDGVRFIACGEYGDTTLRPHYHIILFNVGFSDKRRCGTGKAGDPIYNSKAVNAFMQPFLAPADGAAIRSFMDAVNDPKHDFGRHASDYDLYRLGDFDETEGRFDRIDPVLMISGFAALIKDVSPVK